MNALTKNVLILWLLIIGFVSTTDLFAQSPIRVEPPHWYVGMENSSLQLLVQGKDISNLRPSLKHRGVQLVNVQRVDNPDYLFLDLEIGPEAQPGFFDILFAGKKRPLFRSRYELKERSKGSSQRMSFDSKDVVYLITPDRFVNGDPSNDKVEGYRDTLDRKQDFARHGGDLRGIIDHLDYIKEMGFTSIWLNPVLENAQKEWSYHGYATTDYYKVDPRFGTNEEYLELCDKAKEMGIGIIMDQIANHCGSNHWWMADPPTKDWINHQGDDTYHQTNHRKTTLLDPYASKQDKDALYDGWFVPAMPDLNQRNPFVANYIIQNSIWWIEYADLYGIRQDTYSYPDPNFMSDWTCAIRKEYPRFSIVGEEWVDDAAVIAYWQEGKNNADGYTSCLSSMMDFKLNFIIDKAFNEKEEWGKGLVRLYENLALDHHYADPNHMMVFGDNHDMPRVFKKLNGDYELYKMMMAYVLTTRGIPQVYYGTEILMTHLESDSHGAIREDFPGGWSGDKKSAFSGVGLSPNEKEAQDWLKNLLNWRKTNPVIHTGQLLHYEPKDGSYVYFRYNDDKIVMVVFNKSGEQSIDLNRFREILPSEISGRDILIDKKLSLKDQLVCPEKSVQIIEMKR